MTLALTDVRPWQELIEELPNGYVWLADLRTNLSEARLRHSLEVMQALELLARVYDLPHELALTAGLLHDAAKEMEADRMLRFARLTGWEPVHALDRNPLYLHGPAAAGYAQERYGLNDQRLLDALWTHTLLDNGSHFDDPLPWCLRVADLLGPSRPWRYFQRQLAALALEGNLGGAAVLQWGWIFDLFTTVGNPLHPDLPRLFARTCAHFGLEDVSGLRALS